MRPGTSRRIANRVSSMAHLGPLSSTKCAGNIDHRATWGSEVSPKGQMDHGVCSPVDLVACIHHGVGCGHASVCQRGRLETALGRDAQSAWLLQLPNGIRSRGWARDIRVESPAGRGGPAAPWQGSCVHGSRWPQLFSRSHQLGVTSACNIRPAPEANQMQKCNTCQRCTIFYLATTQ